MHPEQFRAWRARQKMTQAEAGSALGYTRERVHLFEAGKQPIPRAVRLAMLAIDLNYADYDGERAVMREP